MSEADRRWLGELLAAYEIQISALHTLTYTRPDLKLFGDAAERRLLADYLLLYRDFARRYNAGNLVFGSPKARKTNGKDPAELDAIFLEFLKSLDGEFDGLCLHLEPLPPASCEYLHSFAEAAKLIQGQAFRNIAVQLDVRSAMDSGESIDSIFQTPGHTPLIRHVQVGDRGMRPPSDECGDWHRALSAGLSSIKYAGFVAAEVIPLKDQSHEISLERCVAALRNYYGAGATGSGIAGEGGVVAR